MAKKQKVSLLSFQWDISLLKKDPEKQFFLLTGIWFFLLAFAGFTDSFYFKKSQTPTPVYITTHGVIYSTWVLLYLIQCTLSASMNIKLHMLLGKSSIIILPLLLISGYYTILQSAIDRDNVLDGTNLSAVGLGVLAAFIAVMARKRPYFHKRLMVLAMTFITVAAVGRLLRNYWDISGFWLYHGIYLTPLAAMTLFDFLYFKKVKLLSASCFTFVLLITWVEPTAPLFESQIGTAIVEYLNKIFLWQLL